MRKSIFLLPTLFLMVLADLAAVQAGSGPKIVINERLFHFKELVEGQSLEHVFKVVNQGDQLLEIQNIKTS